MSTFIKWVKSKFFKKEQNQVRAASDVYDIENGLPPDGNPAPPLPPPSPICVVIDENNILSNAESGLFPGRVPGSGSDGRTRPAAAPGIDGTGINRPVSVPTMRTLIMSFGVESVLGTSVGLFLVAMNMDFDHVGGEGIRLVPKIFGHHPVLFKVFLGADVVCMVCSSTAYLLPGSNAAIHLRICASCALLVSISIPIVSMMSI